VRKRFLAITPDLLNVSSSVISAESFDFSSELRGISVALSQIESLNKIRSIASKSKLSAESISIANILNSNIGKNLHISEHIKLSTESIDAKDSNITMESISSSIAKIWDMIKKTFAYIWQKITYIFRSIKNDGSIKEMKMKKLDKEIDDLVKKAEYNKNNINEPPYLENTVFLNAFAFLDKEINTSSLLEYIRSLENTGSNIIMFGQAIEITMNNLKNLLDSLESNDYSEFIKTYASMLANNNNAMFSELINFANISIFSNNSDTALRKRINTYFPNGGSEIDSNSLRIMTGFINGGVACFYNESNSDSSALHVKVISNTEFPNSRTKIKIPKLNELKDICINLSKILNKQLDVTDDIDFKYKSIKHNLDICFKTVNSSISNTNNSANPDEMNKAISIINESLSVIANMLSASIAINSMYNNTTEAIFELTNQFQKYYAEGQL